MIEPYILDYLFSWAMAHKNWRGAWRLAKWAMRRQLRFIQQTGIGLDIFGPLIINNVGYIEIGDYSELRSTWHRPISLSVTKPDARLIIENRTFINEGVNIGVAREVVIGACSEIGNECIIYDTDWHSLDGLNQHIPTAPTRIGRGVWLGARVVVLKGVTIGDNTVVAANAVVTRDLPSKVLAAGNPAKVIRPIERNRYISKKSM